MADERSGHSTPPQTNLSAAYRFGPFEADEATRTLRRDGRPVPLGAKAVEMLLVLLRADGTVVARAALLETLWPGGFVTEQNLWQNVYTLRKTLDGPCGTTTIENVRGRGYRFTVPIRRAARHETARTCRLAAPIRAIAAAAAALAVLLSSSPAPRAQPLAREDAQLYALGQYYLSRRTVPAIRTAVGYFRRVVRNEPRNPTALAGMAQALIVLGDYTANAPRANAYFPAAESFARRAVARDPRCAEAHAALGLIEALRYHARGRAERHFDSALRAGPGAPVAHFWRGVALLHYGDLAAGKAALMRAEDLEPASPAISTWLAAAAYYSGDYAGTERYARRALELDPRRTDAEALLGLAYEQHGRWDDAVRLYRTVARTDAVDGALLLAHAYSAAGRGAEAGRVLARLRATRKNLAGYEIDLAAALAQLGQRDRALAALAAVSPNEKELLTELEADPRLTALRGDPAFRRIVERARSIAS